MVLGTHPCHSKVPPTEPRSSPSLTWRQWLGDPEFMGHVVYSLVWLPSGKLTQLWKITMFYGEIDYKLLFSIGYMPFNNNQWREIMANIGYLNLRITINWWLASFWIFICPKFQMQLDFKSLRKLILLLHCGRILQGFNLYLWLIILDYTPWMINLISRYFHIIPNTLSFFKTK